MTDIEQRPNDAKQGIEIRGCTCDDPFHPCLLVLPQAIRSLGHLPAGPAEVGLMARRLHASKAFSLNTVMRRFLPAPSYTYCLPSNDSASRAFRKYLTSCFGLCSTAMGAVRRACLCHMAKLTYHGLTKRCTS